MVIKMEAKLEKRKTGQNITDGWLSKSIIKQGFFISLAIQFFLITLPYFVWKIAVDVGLQGGYGDMVFVMLFSALSIVITSMIGGIYCKKKKVDDKEKRYIKIIQVLAISSNMTGFFYSLISLYLGLNFTLSIDFGPPFTLDVNSLFPFILLVATISLQALEVMIVVINMDYKKDSFGKSLFWGLAFALIPIGAGIFSYMSVLLPGEMYMIFFVSTLMFGVSGFLLNKSDLKAVNVKARDEIQSLVEDSAATELKSFNITGSLFLIGFLLFFYTGPLFGNGTTISGNIYLLLLIPVVIGLGVALLGSFSGDSTLKGRLFGGIGINMICTQITFSQDLTDPLWLGLQTVLIGIAIGLLIEPIFRSILKFKFQKLPFNKISGFAWLSIAIIGLELVLSSGWFGNNSEIMPEFSHLAFWALEVMAIIPFFFMLNYSQKMRLEPTWSGRGLARRILLWLAHIFLVVGCFVLLLLPVIPELLAI